MCLCCVDTSLVCTEKAAPRLIFVQDDAKKKHFVDEIHKLRMLCTEIEKERQRAKHSHPKKNRSQYKHGINSSRASNFFARHKYDENDRKRFVVPLYVVYIYGEKH